MDIFYKITPSCSGTLYLSTCGSDDLPGIDLGVDTVLSVHSGCPVSNSNMIACNDNWNNAVGIQPAYRWSEATWARRATPRSPCR